MKVQTSEQNSFIFLLLGISSKKSFITSTTAGNPKLRNLSLINDGVGNFSKILIGVNRVQPLQKLNELAEENSFDIVRLMFL